MKRTRPKYTYVRDWIKDGIKRHKLVNKLPGERALSEQLGISYMTVRKAVNSLVDEGFLFRIPSSGTYVAKHDHIPHPVTKNIGYLLDDSIKDGLTSPYYSLIFNALEKEAALHGYGLMYFSEVDEENATRLMRKVDGVIVSCLPRIEHIIQEIKRRVPVVVIDNASPDKSIPSVIIDNFNAIVESVDYLQTLGHRRIGFMAGLSDSDVGKNRLAGYRYALKKHGIDECSELLFKGDYSFETGRAGAQYLLHLSPPPTAIICANDSMALGAIKEAHQYRLRIPDDLSIIGFDDISVAAQILPPLTTVAAPISELATTSIEMLIKMICGRPVENRHIALPARLQIRGTCISTDDTVIAQPLKNSQVTHDTDVSPSEH